jgi:hypothetical protein
MHNLVMRKLKHKLIDQLIHTHRPTHKLHRRILWIRKDKIMSIKSRQPLFPDAACHCRDMVDIGLRNHSGHRALDIALDKLVVAMLIPHGLEIEERAVKQEFQERETARMREFSGCRVVSIVGR